MSWSVLGQSAPFVQRSFGGCADERAGQLANDRRLRIPNVVAGFSKPRVGQLVATSITGARLALFLDELGKAPKAVVCDNGPELTSKAMRLWSGLAGQATNGRGACACGSPPSPRA